MRVSHFTIATLLSTALSVGASAQTLTFVGHIDTGGLEVTPVGITADGSGNAYVAGFSQRRVLKIAGFNGGTPVASVLTTTNATDTPAGPIAWITDTGLFTADFKAPNRLVVAGDTFDGTNGGAAIIIDTDTGTILGNSAGVIPTGETTPFRHAGAAWYGPNNLVMQFQAGSNYWFAPNGDFATASFYGGPAPGASRDLAVDAAGTIYVSRNNKWVGDGTEVSIHRIIDTGSDFVLAGNSNEANWFTTTVANSGSAQGIAVGTIDGVESVLLCLRESGKILRIPTTAATVAPATPVEITHAEIEFPADVTVATVGSEQFLLVTQYGRSSAPTSCVTVFSLGSIAGMTPATWQAYD